MTESTNDQSGGAQFVVGQIKIEQIKERLNEIEGCVQKCQILVDAVATEECKEQILVITDQYNTVDKALI